ncbi:MAG: cation transporter [bacterium]
MSVALNVAFVVVEIIFGVLAGSIALLADAAHNIGDVLGLLFAWLAERLARAAPPASAPTGSPRPRCSPPSPTPS